MVLENYDPIIDDPGLQQSVLQGPNVQDQPTGDPKVRDAIVNVVQQLKNVSEQVRLVDHRNRDADLVWSARWCQISSVLENLDRKVYYIMKKQGSDDRQEGQDSVREDIPPNETVREEFQLLNDMRREDTNLKDKGREDTSLKDTGRVGKEGRSLKDTRKENVQLKDTGREESRGRSNLAAAQGQGRNVEERNEQIWTDVEEGEFLRQGRHTGREESRGRSYLEAAQGQGSNVEERNGQIWTNVEEGEFMRQGRHRKNDKDRNRTNGMVDLGAEKMRHNLEAERRGRMDSTASQTDRVKDRPKKTEDQKIWEKAGLTIGLNPIEKKHEWDELRRRREAGGSIEEDEVKREQQGMILAAKEFLEAYMKVNATNMSIMGLHDAFRPRSMQGKSRDTLYVKLKDRHAVALFMSHVRFINPSQDISIEKYIPKQTHKRFKALETIAYELRQKGWKTDIRIGQKDFILKKKKKEDPTKWKDIEPDDLPDDLPGLEYLPLGHSYEEDTMTTRDRHKTPSEVELSVLDEEVKRKEKARIEKEIEEETNRKDKERAARELKQENKRKKEVETKRLADKANQEVIENEMKKKEAETLVPQLVLSKPTDDSTSEEEEGGSGDEKEEEEEEEIVDSDSDSVIALNIAGEDGNEVNDDVFQTGKEKDQDEIRANVQRKFSTKEERIANMKPGWRTSSRNSQPESQTAIQPAGSGIARPTQPKKKAMKSQNSFVEVQKNKLDATPNTPDRG
jgi:hypothetical protein